MGKTVVSSKVWMVEKLGKGRILAFLWEKAAVGSAWRFPVKILTKSMP
ncbi:hypothetical protein C943_02528 [Mariniradius saccharolyticus AK6]|uniref:Uncharacterized protein n=1 Tax=Mariniradius saccharolyticus AK6 TaxID=1239962 RepID=M7Y2F7_9BACT|nr:hypothetical protein C943_02528 [Mariniradius saccharolyticus AK6]